MSPFAFLWRSVGVWNGHEEAEAYRTALEGSTVAMVDAGLGVCCDMALIRIVLMANALDLKPTLSVRIAVDGFWIT